MRQLLAFIKDDFPDKPGQIVVVIVDNSINPECAEVVDAYITYDKDAAEAFKRKWLGDSIVIWSKDKGETKDCI